MEITDIHKLVSLIGEKEKMFSGCNILTVQKHGILFLSSITGCFCDAVVTSSTTTTEKLCLYTTQVHSLPSCIGKHCTLYRSPFLQFTMPCYANNIYLKTSSW